MAMTRGEAAEAFGAVGQDLPFDLLKRLVELTEGWPAALYLASIALDGDDGPEEVVEQFGGDDRVVADYLRSEVLARLNDEEQDFLIRASLFDRLTGDLCDAVLERTGSGEALRRLSRSNLLLSPVDSKDTEFRMHALLREMLRAELGRVGAVEVADLHRRAADWFHSRGDVDESIAQVVASGDAELAGERIWEVCPEYEARGRRATLRSWILSLPEERIATVPSLAMVVAVGALTDGDGPALRHWAGAAEKALATSGDPDPQLFATAEVLMLTQETSGGLREAADRLNELHDGFPEHHVWRTLCRLMGGSLFYLLGDRDRARPLLEEGARIGAMSGPAVQTICLSQLCLIALDEGRSGDAEQLASEALSRIALFGVEDYAASAVPYAAAALVRAHRGNAQGAAQLLSVADELLDSNPILNDWFGSEARVTAARAHLALGDLGVARKRLQEANALRERVPEAVVLDEWIESVREALDSGSAATGRWPLTPAELRLLQLLPTHMTFPEIATQLIVSTNTVKTQARSIYRKLGVSSRSEAVACARMGGLLDQVEERSPRSG